MKYDTTGNADESVSCIVLDDDIVIVYIEKEK